jgi:hypothetical protein
MLSAHYRFVICCGLLGGKKLKRGLGLRTVSMVDLPAGWLFIVTTRILLAFCTGSRGLDAKC